MARKAKTRGRKRAKNEIVFFNIRMPERLRGELERAAQAAGYSMNTEIVRRLEDLLRGLNVKKLIADALYEKIDDEVMGIMFERYEEDFRVYDHDEG